MNDMNCVLRWGGNAHCLSLHQIGPRVKADLEVNKDGEQFCCDSCTAEVTVTEIQKGWRDQGLEWNQVYVKDVVEQNGRYFAIRIIYVDGNECKGCFIWTVDHRNGIPNDSLIFAKDVTADQVAKGYA